jgi:hypothetical protein
VCLISPLTNTVHLLIGNTARSVYAAILRLPRPHLPLGSTTHRAPLDEDMLHGADVTKPTPFFQRHVYSDSDDEGSYTAIDRDARLAYAVRQSFAVRLAQNIIGTCAHHPCCLLSTQMTRACRVGMNLTIWI